VFKLLPKTYTIAARAYDLRPSSARPPGMFPPPPPPPQASLPTPNTPPPCVRYATTTNPIDPPVVLSVHFLYPRYLLALDTLFGSQSSRNVFDCYPFLVSFSRAFEYFPGFLSYQYPPSDIPYRMELQKRLLSPDRVELVDRVLAVTS